MGERVPEQPFSGEAAAKLRRRTVEIGFGARVAEWLSTAGAQVKSTAELSLGMSRNDLNDVVQGVKHMRAAWLELLPPAVELAYLRERAAAHLLELRPKCGSDATFAEVLMHVGMTITACGQTEADGYVSPDEAVRDIPILVEVIAKLEAVLAQRQRALTERGLMIKASGGGK